MADEDNTKKFFCFSCGNEDSEGFACECDYSFTQIKDETRLYLGYYPRNFVLIDQTNEIHFFEDGSLIQFVSR